MPAPDPIATEAAAGGRIAGFDAARALAFFGMVVVNFEVVMGAGRAGAGWLVGAVGALEGRAAATFVVLAGVGLSLLAGRARSSGEAMELARVRRRLLARALFLFAVGLLYTPLWPADILHFYGIYIAVGALLLRASGRALWGLAALFALAFVVLLLAFDYEAGWDWETLSYGGFWTPAGMVRHLFFNGFHPVIPWTAFLLAGMWLGRQELGDRRARARIGVLAALVLVAAEGLSRLLVSSLSEGASAETTETVGALLGTAPMPPMPLYLLSAGASAFLVIALCASLTAKRPDARWVRPLAATGQLALTLYVAHVLIGMGALELGGMLEDRSLAFAVGSALLFCAASVVFSALWRGRFRRGPLELVMRRMTR